MLPILEDGWRRWLSDPSSVLATAAGVVWSTVSLILLLSFGQGFRAHIERNLEKTGDRWTALVGEYTTRGKLPGRPVQIDARDLAGIRSRLHTARDVAAEVVRQNASVTTEYRTRASIVSAATPEIQRIKRLHDARGRFFDAGDETALRPVAVLGAALPEILFGGEDPIGKTVKVEGFPFEVVGVLERVGEQLVVTAGPNDETVWIPLQRGMRVLGAGRTVDWLWLEPGDVANNAALAAEARDVVGDAYSVLPADEKALRIFSIVDMIGPVRRISAALPVFLGLVGAMSLAVAGIGVANLTVTQVVNRRVEIATHRACGARRSDVAVRILAESLATVLVPGAVGAGIAAALLAVISALPLPEMLPRPSLSPGVVVVTIVFLTLTGVLAGIVPARLAMRVDPAIGLRAV